MRLVIRKGVPVAGGMGGGSADAAAALVACDALWGTALGPDRLRALAARLGADVPFALLGASAVGLGRGDVLTPVPTAGRFDWVLVTSERGLSTPEVYRTLDILRGDTGELGDAADGQPEVSVDVLDALRLGAPGELAAGIRNDLQKAAAHLRPDLADTIAAGERLGALIGVVSGSGPTVAFLARNEEAAIELARALRADGHDAFAVHGPVEGACIVSSPPRRPTEEGTST